MVHGNSWPRQLMKTIQGMPELFSWPRKESMSAEIIRKLKPNFRHFFQLASQNNQHIPDGCQHDCTFQIWDQTLLRPFQGIGKYISDAVQHIVRIPTSIPSQYFCTPRPARQIRSPESMTSSPPITITRSAEIESQFLGVRQINQDKISPSICKTKLRLSWDCPILTYQCHPGFEKKTDFRNYSLSLPNRIPQMFIPCISSFRQISKTRAFPPIMFSIGEPPETSYKDHDQGVNSAQMCEI